MRVAHAPAELERRPRAVAIGTFDGVHRGHRAVLDATLAADGVPTAVTFHPHPRVVLGYQVDLLCTIERRLELLAAAGVEETLVVEFTPEVAMLEPAAFVRDYLEPLGAEIVVAGEGFRFGRLSGGGLDTIRELGIAAQAVPILDGVSSTHIRRAGAHGRRRRGRGLARGPFELDGVVVTGDQRGGTLGFPTANLRVAPELLVPAFGIYAGAVGDRRAAVSIGSTRTTAARTADRSLPARLAGRPVRQPAHPRALAASCATSGSSRAKPSSSTRSPATSRRPARSDDRSSCGTQACGRELRVVGAPSELCGRCMVVPAQVAGQGSCAVCLLEG